MIDMGAKLSLLVPEMLLLIGAVLTSVLGLSRSARIRDAVPGLAAGVLAASAIAVFLVSTPERVDAAGLLVPWLGKFVKVMLAVVGVALVATGAGAVDRRLEEAVARGHAAFDPIRVVRGEYHAFLLLSVAGAMLLCNAGDLIWLFLAVELSSLPTYIMVAVGRGGRKAQEAAVKYFFLGAMAAAMMLYGFALLYGSTGTVKLPAMRDAFAAQIAATGSLEPMALAGMALAVLGAAFKITAVPMHFYAPDVYEGASTPVTAFLSFVPKTAGFVLLIVLLSTVGWQAPSNLAGAPPGLPGPLTAILWMVAVMTMTLGNVGALLQRSVKRTLAYSSIANSGYMLVGLIAGPRMGGLGAVLFFLLCYGIMNTAVFAVLAAIERHGEEVDRFEDLSGLRARHPVLSWVMAAGAISLMGFPPILGFWGKFNLFVAGFNAGQVALVVIAALNSVVAAFYYLRFVQLPLVGVVDSRAEAIRRVPSRWPAVAAVACGLAVLVMWLAANPLVDAAALATGDRSSEVVQPVKARRQERTSPVALLPAGPQASPSITADPGYHPRLGRP